MSVGARLREARRRRGLSLLQLSQTTKISTNALQAIEGDEAWRLPGGIFTRGFLRAYSGAVGLDPEEIVREYVATFEASPPDPAIEPTAPELPTEAEGRPSWLSLVVTAGLLAVAVMVHSYVSSRGEEDSPSAGAPSDRAVATSGKAGAPAERSADAGAVSGMARDVPPSSARSPLTIEMEATSLCWVSVTSDGTRVVYRLMNPGERETARANREIVLRVGDSGAFRFSINGAAARPLGNRGEASTIRVTHENYRSLLGRQG